jgi:integrase
VTGTDQPDRYTCCRCGSHQHYPLNLWPDGRICRACRTRAVLTHGRCSACGQDRALPGRSAQGLAICRDCAGIRRDFTCTRCGVESALHTGRLCPTCYLNDRLAILLDDGAGRVNPALQPLMDLLTSAASPAATLHMLRSGRGPRKILTELAAGRIELSHEGLDAYGPPLTTAFVRSMLVAAGLLPAVDQTLLDFERFVRQRLTGLAGHPHQRLLRQFGLWHQLPRMRAKAATKPLTFGAYTYAQQQFVAAESFLTWLVQTGRQTVGLAQADIDAWMPAARRADRERARGFLNWAMASRRLPALDVAMVPRYELEPITQQQRLDLLHRLAVDDTIALPARIIGSLVLLYAQPLSRIRTLTLDDITTDDHGEVHIGLGSPPSPVPQPFAEVLLQLSARRIYPNAPAKAEQRWLFPGRNVGQPVHYKALRTRLSSIGIPPRSTRVSALRQLVLQVPAPVVATALGFHYKTTERQNRSAAGVWNRYAAGD